MQQMKYVEIEQEISGRIDLRIDDAKIKLKRLIISEDPDSIDGITTTIILDIESDTAALALVRFKAMLFDSGITVDRLCSRRCIVN